MATATFHSRMDVGFPLRDRLGKRIGNARFVNGEWVAANDELAEAMRRLVSVSHVGQFGIHEVKPTAAPEVVSAEEGPVEPTPVTKTAGAPPEPKPARSRHATHRRGRRSANTEKGDDSQ